MLLNIDVQSPARDAQEILEISDGYSTDDRNSNSGNFYGFSFPPSKILILLIDCVFGSYSICIIDASYFISYCDRQPTSIATEINGCGPLNEIVYSSQPPHLISTVNGNKHAKWGRGKSVG